MLVRAAEDAQEVTEALALRERVFCGEQGVELAAEQDGRDPEALHVVAFGDGTLVGTCRVLLDGEVARLGRMAVEPDLRNRGIGAAVLEEAERRARESGARAMRLHAQVAAEDARSAAQQAQDAYAVERALVALRNLA